MSFPCTHDLAVTNVTINQGQQVLQPHAATLKNGVDELKAHLNGIGGYSAGATQVVIGDTGVIGASFINSMRNLITQVSGQTTCSCNYVCSADNYCTCNTQFTTCSCQAQTFCNPNCACNGNYTVG